MNLNLEYSIRKAQDDLNNVIILLHGYGSNKEDLFSFADLLPANSEIISLQAPLNTPYGGFAWFHLHMENNSIRSDFNDIIKASEIIKQDLLKIKEHYRLSDNKINIIGFSQGAILSYVIAINNPNLINSIIAFSGFLNGEYAVEEKINMLKKVNIFVSHGIYDQVIPIQAARKTHENLNKFNIEHFYKEYEVDHGVSQECLNDAINWLKNK